ncbi:MAG TPA: DNA-binding protein WhiA [Clostridia bacterium]|nr:DNA-binding protein WhiA [Clostridia bacterium]
MSFSSGLKDELTKARCTGADERNALLCALAHTSASMKFSAGGLSIEFVTESQSVAELIAKLAADLYALSATLLVRRQEGLGKKNYVVSASGTDCAKLLADYGCLPREGAEDYIPGMVPDAFLLGEKVARCFIRGAFLGAGSLSDPRKGYHLEIVCRYERFAQILRDLLADFEINARVSERKQGLVVYLKDGESIADFLRLVGAVDAVLAFENIRVIRFTANELNRRSNFESANMQKTARANAQQLVDIRLIHDTRGLTALPPPLRETAEARLNNEEASLAELARELSIGKSGLNHRLAKLAAIAEDIRLHGAGGKGRDA